MDWFSAPREKNKFGIAEWMQEFRPTNRYHYFDRIRILVKDSPSPEWLKELDTECGSVVNLGRFWANPLYTKLEIYQPSPKALLQLATLPDEACTSYVEIACDLTTHDLSSVEMIAKAFQHGFLQPHHRKKKVKAFDNDSGSVTGFTTRANPQKGKRRRGFWFQWYSDRPCKILDEPYCFHFEGKHEGGQAVKRLGIHHPRDLSKFDYDEYFSKHFGRLYYIDYDRLGRFDENRRNGRRRKKSFDSDRRKGQALYRVFSLDPDETSRSLQSFVDRYGRGPFLRPYDILCS
jgi:hypothetical protein